MREELRPNHTSWCSIHQALTRHVNDQCVPCLDVALTREPDPEQLRAQFPITYGVEYYDTTDARWIPLTRGTDLTEADETFEFMQRKGHQVRLVQHETEIIRTGRAW